MHRWLILYWTKRKNWDILSLWHYKRCTGLLFTGTGVCLGGRYIILSPCEFRDAGKIKNEKMIRMKQVATKITEYVKKSKRAKLYGVFGLIYLIAVIFVMNDAWLYQTPIAKLTKVETSIAGENKSTRGTQEIKYKQKIRGVILNGTNKGKIVDFSNEY